MSSDKDHQEARKSPLEDADVARAFVKTAATLSRSLSEENSGTWSCLRDNSWGGGFLVWLFAFRAIIMASPGT